MGDPAGIGPEIIVKTLNNPQTQEEAHYLITGDRSVLENACTICGISKTILDEDFVEIIDLKTVLPIPLNEERFQKTAGKPRMNTLKKRVLLLWKAGQKHCALPLSIRSPLEQPLFHLLDILKF